MLDGVDLWRGCRAGCIYLDMVRARLIFIMRRFGTWK